VSESSKGGVTRRDAIKVGGGIAVASALAGVALPAVHAGENNTLGVALVGCGGRGTGAAANALRTTGGPIRLVAMADVFDERLKTSHENLTHRDNTFASPVEIPDDRKFIGFDAYKKAMDCLRPGDVVILATPPAFRWVHFTYAIQKGLNVFMEKPVAVDGPSCRRMFKLAEESERRGMKVGVGLMCRHCEARGEQFRRIKDGQIGDLTLLRAYRMAGKTAMESSFPKPDGMSELLYQIKRFHSFLWASGGCYSDFLIHNIDECCWMKDAWPVEARASGGRHYRGHYIDQNFDHYSVEYTFKDGAKLYLEGRTINGCQQRFASYAHGTRGSAVISAKGHTPCHCGLYKGQHVGERSQAMWTWAPKKEPDPYQLEWDHLVADIRADKPHNEVKRGTEASLVTAMGRMAAHTGQAISYDRMLNCEHEFAPGLDQLTMESEAPLKSDANGRYPVPMPGKVTSREFEDGRLWDAG
jgi:predicted dehydrogenase